MFSDESAALQDLVPDNPPPPDLRPKVESAIFNAALDRLQSGKGGFILVHEKNQAGDVHQTNGALVRRLGDDISVQLWVGREWGKPGTVSVAASVIWEFD